MGGAVVYLTSRSASSGFRGVLKHSMDRLWLEEKRWWVGAELTFCALNSSAAVKLLPGPCLLASHPCSWCASQDHGKS